MTAEQAVPPVHFDRDYERLARVSGLQQRWLVPDGALASTQLGHSPAPIRRNPRTPM
jgi:hypothetical protein